MTTKTKTQAASVKDGRAEAVAEFLGCSVDELSKEKWDLYGLEVYSFGREQYAVGNDNDADQAARCSILDTLWAFRAQFIVSECGLPVEMEEALQALQEKKCEGANDSILALVKRSPGGVDGFVEAAISADGRGHFLSNYDGDESEINGFYIYRQN